MFTTIIISLITSIMMIILILKKPAIKLGKIKIETFWIVAFVGAIFILIFDCLPLNVLFNSLITNNSINPVRILIIFISISLISITLDELGFFNYIAIKAINFVKGSQYKLFFTLYLIIAILTIFTSNDIIIITFTLFICYFTKAAKINPLPYLVMEFVVANTYSMTLYIGNPTNIYLASTFDIDFIEYFKVMIIPTLSAGITSILVLLLLFHKSLQKNFILKEKIEITIKHKPLMIISLLVLLCCIFLIAISKYINIEMWLICFLSVLFLSIIVFLFGIKQGNQKILISTYKRAPWSLIIFVLSMFTIVLALNYHGITGHIASLFNNLSSDSKFKTIFIYGVTSSLVDNLINNIPMTLAYSFILNGINSSTMLYGIYATIIGSNIGAFLTPIGALAGIMWMNILKKQGIDFSFKQFTRYGVILSSAILFSSLFSLYLVI